MILLDTDTCVEILRGNQHVIDKRLETDEHVALSFMTVGELYYGAEKSKPRTKNKHLVDEFLLSVDVIHTDLDILQKFGEIKAVLEIRNLSLADADIFIAATCLSKCKKLITANVKHFDRIENLTIENWIR
ncbi:type II toxin-antitoxin system VapC family toxin [candidate division KSB1 bacterium]|nr:type II toxin-antitoxin system VapC family toxin [candidate division KSB1 bacterium]